MIDVALQNLLVQGSRLPTAQVTPSTEVRPLTQTLPRIAWTLISDPSRYTDSGVMALRTARYQLDIFAQSLSSGRSVQRQLMARADLTDADQRGLDGYTGTIDRTLISRVYFDGPSASRGEVIQGQNQTIARCSVDVFVNYRELPVQQN